MTEALRQQAVAYLLGELEGEELASLEHRLAADPALREEVKLLEPTVTELRRLPREAWEAVEPPPLALPATEPPHAQAAEPEPSRPRWLSWPRLVVVGAACAGAVRRRDHPRHTARRRRRRNAGKSLGRPAPARRVRGERLGAARRRRSARSDGHRRRSARDAPGTYYELWLLRDDELVALGSFTVGADGHADTAISIPVDPRRYDAFDVSVEREDGDPSHSGDSVLRGPTASS